MRIPRLGSAARAMLAAIIFFCLSFSVLATEFPYIVDDYQVADSGFWAGQGTSYDIYARTLTGAIMPPLVADLDDDGTNEIIVFDATTIRIYEGMTIIPTDTYTAAAAQVGSYVFDWDGDGKDNIIFLQGTFSDGANSLIRNFTVLSYNGTDFNSTYLDDSIPTTIDSATGQSALFCDAVDKHCLIVFSSAGTYGANDLWFGSYSHSGGFAAERIYSSGSGQLYCMPIAATAQYTDYDSDGSRETIFTIMSAGLGIGIHFAVWNASGNDYIQERIILESGGFEPVSGTCLVSDISMDITSPSTFDYDPGGTQETVIAYHTTEDSGNTRMKCYTATGASCGTFGDTSSYVMSGILRGNFFEDDDQSFCVVGQYNTGINVLCGSVYTGYVATDRVYSGSWDGYPIKRRMPYWENLMFASNEDSDSYSEIVSGFGVLDLELPGGLDCTLLGLCDVAVDWENPKEAAVVVPVDYQGIGRQDLIMHTGANLWYFDDQYSYHAPSVLNITLNPCRGSTWKINTTVEARVIASSEDDSTIRVKAMLYYGTAAAIDSGWTALLPEGTTFVFSFTANTTVGSGVLRVMLNDSHSLTDYEDLSFSVGNDGVEFGDCIDSIGYTPSGAVAVAGTNVSQLPSSGNQIEELVNTLEQASGLGSTLLWVIFMLCCSIAVVVAAIRGGWGGGAMGMMLLIFNGGLLVMGAILGFISTGVVVVLALVCIAALGLWVKDAFAGGGA